MASTEQGKIVGEGTRSLVKYHKSGLLQTLTTLFWSIPLVLGLTAEQQSLRATVVQLMTYPATGLHSSRVSLSDSRLQVGRAAQRGRGCVCGW